MKTNRILLYCTILLAALCAEPVVAQSGTEALDKAVSKLEASNGTSAAFTLTLFNALNEPVEKQSGTLKLRGDKFYWKTGTMTVWYNGKQQWAYLNGEVNLTEPTAEEIAAVNPYILINTYKQNFQVKALKAKNNKESISELTPKKKGANIERIVVTINTTTWTPSAFTIYFSDRTHSHIVLSKYLTGQNFPNSTFVFDPKQYPDAELIDLR